MAGAAAYVFTAHREGGAGASERGRLVPKAAARPSWSAEGGEGPGSGQRTGSDGAPGASETGGLNGEEVKVASDGGSDFYGGGGGGGQSGDDVGADGDRERVISATGEALGKRLCAHAGAASENLDEWWGFRFCRDLAEVVTVQCANLRA